MDLATPKIILQRLLCIELFKDQTKENKQHNN